MVNIGKSTDGLQWVFRKGKTQGFELKKRSAEVHVPFKNPTFKQVSDIFRLLWRTCQDWGMVIDVFVANKLSNEGIPFAFVRFIKVTDIQGLISNLRSTWMGSYRIFADVSKFERKDGRKRTVNGTPPDHVKVLKVERAKMEEANSKKIVCRSLVE
ncbi:hypothetical protein L1987_20927 [Smallanthus sonchifolius]|uniref:Uncharacterized protein n=1 Tax=Smallanthus sonchifolius TaxID=185202 RepID=A0ACB9ISJ9_9ASTR|nr:hypothetical protein L1987_20927 [Smallanthus sonchifolius]